MPHQIYIKFRLAPFNSGQFGQNVKNRIPSLLPENFGDGIAFGHPFHIRLGGAGLVEIRIDRRLKRHRTVIDVYFRDKTAVLKKCVISLLRKSVGRQEH